MKTNQKRLAFIKTLPSERTEPTIIIGKNTQIDPSTVIGGDGFGHEWDGEKLVEFPHHGGVLIRNEVRIGANCTIDRAAIADDFTEIGFGTKMDDHIHIGHNCNIGEHNAICAGAIFSGGVVTGDRVFVGVGAMIKQKVHIGDDATIGMGAVVLDDVPAKAIVVGNPAKILKYEE